MASPAELIRQVKQEATKVVWPSRRETIMATVMICIVVAIFAFFFFAVDYVISSGVKWVLGLDL